MGKRRSISTPSDNPPEFEKSKRAAERANVDESKVVDIGELLSESKLIMHRFRTWLVGDTPLICHAWSEKAKRDMLKAQTGATRVAKEKRDPDEDFTNSLYPMGDNGYGFPVTGVKKAILECAHKDRGIARTDVQKGFWVDAEFVPVRPALAGAFCNLPLVRIWGDEPIMREDMGRIGTGLRKTANLIYRAQFNRWAILLVGGIEPRMVPAHALGFLVNMSGRGVGVGEWRNEKGGLFGAFHLGNLQEQEEWDAFKDGRGPIPGTPYPAAEAAE